MVITPLTGYWESTEIISTIVEDQCKRYKAGFAGNGSQSFYAIFLLRPGGELLYNKIYRHGGCESLTQTAGLVEEKILKFRVD